MYTIELSVGLHILEGHAQNIDCGASFEFHILIGRCVPDVIHINNLRLPLCLHLPRNLHQLHFRQSRVFQDAANPTFCSKKKAQAAEVKEKEAPAAEAKNEDNYKYVSEETVQSVVFLAYIAYKKGLALFKDIVQARDLYNTSMVLLACLIIIRFS